MKHIGIIAEFNPFHNGHAHIIREAKRLFPEKQLVILMSGDFVQRGAPAIFNKYIRTKCALFSGADLVLELPSLFSSASAEHFATAAVLALNATNIIDTLCFGTETSQLNQLKEIASFLLKEPASYQKILQEDLSNGLSYAKARAHALTVHFSNRQYEELLKQPNNILAIEYLKAIEKYNLAIEPVAIPRIGSGYHSNCLSTPLCSATAIRNAIQQNENIDRLHSYMPKSSFNILSDSPDAKPLFWDDFMPYLQYALLYPDDSFDMYCDISREFANTLSSCASTPCNFAQLTDRLSGKHISNSRVQRCLLNILLHQTKSQMESAKSTNYISYLRLLGFRDNHTSLLKDLKQDCQVPVINKVTQARQLLSPDAFALFREDIRKSHLYNQAFYNRYQIQLPFEYEHSVIIHK